MKTKLFALSLFVFALCFNAFAQAQKPQPFLPLSEVREGMKGTARTVFRGSQPEEFNVEILGVVPGFTGPKQDVIVGRLSGANAERTQVFAGMSGSPVYIDGKLVGAIAYSFPFSKEPICGITPIEQMISIFEKNPAAQINNNQPRPISFTDLQASTFKLTAPKTAAASSQIFAGGASANSPLNVVAGQTFQPIATPMTFAGVSQETLNLFAPQLASYGLMPVASVGGAARITPLKKADDTTLQGGASVSMQMARGDYSIAAAGTVTYRDGDKIYAFGHPFLSLGISDLPMSESHVITVVPNMNNSFKLAVPDEMVGSMTQDRATGVYGALGQAPKMIPVHLNLQTSRGQTEKFNFEVAKDDFLTPLLLNILIYNSISANEREIGDSTVSLTGEIKIKNQEPIKLDQRFGGARVSQIAALSVAAPVGALIQSRFDNAEISEINLNAVSVDGAKSATLERIAVDKTEVKAGETVEVEAYARTESGQIFAQKIPVKIPADTPAGTLLVSVGDGSAVQQVAASKQFVPKDLTELIRTINQIKRDDRLYVQTYRVTNGAIIGANELPNLPPSMLATLNNDRTAGGFKPTIMTVLTEQQIAPADFIVSGQQVLTVEVVK